MGLGAASGVDGEQRCLHVGRTQSPPNFLAHQILEIFMRTGLA
jgi:hypothetical protein